MLVYVIGILGPVQSWVNAVVTQNSFPPEVAYFLDIMPFLLLIFIVTGAAVAVSSATSLG
jgi:hypothetical protein